MAEEPRNIQLRRLDLPSLVLATRLDEAVTALQTSEVGLVLTGEAGLGKSALAAQVLRRLHAEGWAVVLHAGRWLPQQFFWSVAEALEAAVADFPGRLEAREVLANDRPDKAKLETVLALLSQSPLVLLFDDLGANLGQEGFTDPGFAEVLGRLCAATQRGRILATSRQMPPGDRLRALQVTPLDEAAAEQAMSQMRGLGKLSPADRAPILSALRGHPRLIELAASWLVVGGQDDADALAQLQAALPRAPQDPKQAIFARLDGAMRNLFDASMLAGGVDSAEVASQLAAVLQPEQTEAEFLRTTLLNLVVSTLNEERLEVLLQAAISETPLTAALLAAACQREVEATDAAIRRLLGLGLLAPASHSEVVVHRWIAEGLARYQGAGLADRHERAISAHYAQVKNGSTYTSMVAITRHLTAVKGFGDLTQFALDVTKPVPQSMAAAALLGEVVPVVPLDHPRLVALVERQMATLRNLELSSGAKEVAERFLQRIKAWVASLGEEQPPDDRIAFAYDRLGDAARMAGESALSEEAYLRALRLRTLRFEEAPSGQTLRMLCVSFEHLADLVRAGGDLVAAERFYRTRLAAAEAFLARQPEDQDAVREHAQALDKLNELLAARS